MKRLSLWIVLSALATGGCAGRDTTATTTADAVTHHGEVDWAQWSRSTFERAQAQDRIILINVVAQWCHWCHVMEEETYADPEVAALLAEHFVTIRIDSDARPDVAERYRAWGWPATAILTPGAQPVLELRGFQRPEAFKKLLSELVAERNAGTLRRREVETPRKPPDADLARLTASTTKQLDHYYDDRLGGWGERQKYPFPAPVEHALFRATAHGQPKWRARALKTLRNQQSLIDPVWGGMYQYSVGGTWDDPHFEKITAIQAGAIETYAKAYATTGEDSFRGSALAVTRYMLEHMQDPAGGFYTSQDADLRRPDGSSVVGQDYYDRDDTDRRALGIPRIDKAVYADLNGQMIAALTELYAATGDQSALAAATKAATRILRTHATDRGGLSHGPGSDDPLLYLRDQAAMGRGLLGLYRVTGDATWLQHATRLGAFVAKDLQDPSGGLFAHTADPAAVGVFAQRRKPVKENGLAARFVVELHRYLDGDGTTATPYLEVATRALKAVGHPQQIHEEGRVVGTYLMALEEATMATVDVTVVGAPGDARTQALRTAALRYPDPRKVVERSDPGTRYPDIGKPAVYLCTETACSSPVSDPKAFAAKADAFLADSLPPR